MAAEYACAETCTARVTESKSSPKPRVAEQGWPGASLAALSTKVPPFFARPLAEHFLRRKAPDICAPQAKKISVAGQPTHFCDEIMPLHARTCSWWSSQRLQLKQRSSSLQPAEHRLHHTLARSAHLPEANGVGETLAGSRWEAISGRTTHKNVAPSRDGISSGSSPSRWKHRQHLGTRALHGDVTLAADPRGDSCRHRFVPTREKVRFKGLLPLTYTVSVCNVCF